MASAAAATPLPWARVGVVLLVFLSESFSITLLFPFIAFMVNDFHEFDKNDTDYYVGIVASAFLLGQCVSSSFWGWLSDRVGRRPVLLTGLAANAVTIVLFGMSTTYGWAVAMRALNGLFNGNVSVIKVYLREVTDSTNQAQAFALMGVTIGAGSIGGPLIGGFLAGRPTAGSDALLDRYPYLMPCLVSSVVASLGFLLGLFFLEESLQPHDVHRKRSGFWGRRSSLVLNTGPSEDTELLPSGRKMGLNPAPNSTRGKDGDTTVMQVFLQRDVLLTTFFLSIVYFVTFASDAIFNVWSRHPPVEHGLGFTMRDIGMTMIAQGAAFLVFQTFLYHRLDDMFGTLRVLQLGLISGAVVVAAPPLLVGLTSATPPHVTTSLWVAVETLYLVRGVAFVEMFTASIILVNNVINEHTGAVNGLVSSITALVRAMGPALGTYCLAWSENAGMGFPFDYHFVFALLASCLLLGLALTASLSQGVNMRSESADCEKRELAAATARMQRAQQHVAAEARREAMKSSRGGTRYGLSNGEERSKVWK